MTSPQFETWWERTPPELHRPSRVEVYKSWEKALKRWLKDNEGKDETDFADVLLISLSAEIRYRKQKEESREFHPAWCMGTTYLNQSRWTAEFVDVPVSKLKSESEQSLCQCGTPVIGPSYSKCCYCYSMSVGVTVPELRQGYKNMMQSGSKENMIAKYREVQQSLRRR